MKQFCLLLERIDELESFSQEERLLLYKYLNIGYNEEEAAAEEAKADAPSTRNSRNCRIAQEVSSRS